MVNTFDKKQLRKVSNLIGFAFILQIIFTLAIMLFFGSGLSLVDNTMVLALSNVVPPLVAFSFVIFALKFKFSDVISVKVPAVNIVPYVAVGLGLTSVASLFSTLICKILNFFHIDSSTPNVIFEYEPSVFGIIVYIISYAVVPALMEEFVYRGVILGSLRNFGDKFAIFVSAVLFALVHGNVEQGIAALVMGLVFGYFAVKTKSIWTSVVLHFFNNLIALLLNVFKLSENFWVCLAIDVVFITVSAACFLCFLHKKGKNELKLNQEKEITPKKLLSFFLTPGMILMVAYILFAFGISFKTV